MWPLLDWFIVLPVNTILVSSSSHQNIQQRKEEKWAGPGVRQTRQETEWEVLQHVMMRLIVFDGEGREILRGGCCVMKVIQTADKCCDILVYGADVSDWYQYLITALRIIVKYTALLDTHHTSYLYLVSLSLKTTMIWQFENKAGVPGRLWGRVACCGIKWEVTVIIITLTEWTNSASIGLDRQQAERERMADLYIANDVKNFYRLWLHMATICPNFY